MALFSGEKFFLLLLTALLLTGNNSFSQRPGNDRARLEVSGEVKKMTVVTHAVAKKYNAGEFDKQSLTDSIDYEFNELGNLSFSTQHISHGYPGYSFTYTYDSLGRLVREMRSDYSMYETQGDIVDFVTAFFYNSDNTQREGYSLRRGERVLSERNLYDTKANLLMEQIFDVDGEPGSEYAYTYDASGNAVKVDYFNAKTNVRNGWTRKFDKAGRKLEESYYKSPGVLELRSVFSYNANGDVTRRDRYDANNKPSQRVLYKYEYDSRSNWTKKVEYENGNPVTLTIRSISYF